ncbi:max-like protein X [Oppia nitens]|uniref:max-like protein X n=1 Tax=Oppia nitens TaxID=1686743 RepID=UPI0023DB58BA|nr:max-like protein X [Oppia nitens]
MNPIYGSNYSSTSATSTTTSNVEMPLSSGQNTDCSLTTDDEDSDQKSSISYKERRREAHTQAEQKRRDAIKRGYEDLQHLVPTCAQHDSTTSYKLSKATILQRSIDYIQKMSDDMRKEEKELNRLRKEVVGLQIMKGNYEKMVKQHQQSQPGLQTNQITDEKKFAIFVSIFDQLFESFDKSVEINNFDKLSDCTIHWIEENCKPQTLQEMVVHIMRQKLLDK